MSDEYPVSEDTLLLEDSISNRSGGLFLEIGTGSGYVLLRSASRFNYSVGTDLVKEGLIKAKEAAKKERVLADFILCDLASALRDNSFDLVAFNPPYLPSRSLTDLATNGLRDGVQVPARFLEDAIRVVRSSGEIIFITSTISEYEELLKLAEERDFKAKVLMRKKLFFEELLSVSLRPNA